MDLARYAPELVLRRLGAHPEPPAEPWGEAFPAAVMWVDISGFTPLTERLVAAGPAGVEALTDVLNRYYGRLVELVHQAGGDITQFEGDAILAVWRLSAADELPGALARVAACALAVSAELHGFEVGEGVTLSQRVAVASGTMRFLWVGGVLARWACATAGEPLAKVQAIDHDVAPGQVVVSADAWPLLAARARGTALPTGAWQLLGLEGPEVPRALERSEASAAILPALRTLLPGAVLSRLQAGQGRWLAELRTISVLFVSFPELDPLAPDVLDRAQAVVEHVQHAVYRWGASTLKFSMADKGATLLAGFGVPPMAHEDDAVRAVQAAMAIVEALEPLGVHARVGVTTGQVFCGLLGSDARCEYTVLGRPVNLAARLMQVADGVLVDEVTWQAARQRLGFATLPAVTLRGVPGPVPVFRPTGEERAVVRDRTEIVGRTEELDVVARGLQDLVRAGRSGAVILEGEAGIGKSRLVAEAIATAADLGVQVLSAEAQAIERDTAYFSWREVASHLLDVDLSVDQASIRAAVEAQLAHRPELQRLAPLLEVVLPIDWPDTDHTAEMAGEMRADNTRRLLMRLVQAAARAQPTMLVIEDAHWLDSASWALLGLISREVHPCFLLLATRPLPEPHPAEYAALRAHPETQHLLLGNLSPVQTLQLVCQRLGVARLPARVEAVLVSKSDGNPFFSEELAYALRDAGVLLIDGGTCGLAPGEDLDAVSLPSTVQGAIISRVDRLEPAQQLLLKVASVIGREFLERTLRYAYPDEETGDSVDELLPTVLDLELLLPELAADEQAYLFKHAISQETIYGLMLFSQRRELHARVAGWFEAHALDIDRYYPLLAWHWSRAEEAEKAAHYLELAGTQALGRFANQEAVRFFERALALFDRHPEVASAARRTAMEEGLAHAHHGAGQMDACRAHGLAALELLGRPSARSTPGLIVGLLGQVGLRILQGWWPRRFMVEAEARRPLLASARIENKFSEIAVFREENLRCLYSALRQVNLAHPAGPSPELGRAYAVMSTMLGTVPLPKVADAWVRRALDTAGQLDSRLDRAWILNRCACYELYRGHWDTVYAWLHESIEVTETLGDRRLHEENLVVEGLADMYRGRFAKAAELMGRLTMAARASGNQQTASWGAIGQAESLARMGDAEGALALCAEVADWIDGGSQSSERVWGHAVQAIAWSAAGEEAAALRHADFVFDNYIGKRPVAFWNQQTAPAVGRIYFGVIRRRGGDAGLERKLRKVARSARAFGRIFPFGAAWAPYLAGLVAVTRGKPAKACARFRQAIATAERLDLAYEQGLGHQALGEWSPAEHPDRRRHRARAQEILAATCQAEADLADA